MQGLSDEIRLIWSEFKGFLSIVISGVADQRMADMRHMDADLVCAPGFKAAFHQCAIFELLQCPEMGDGMLSTSIGEHCHFLTIMLGSPDLCRNLAGGRRGLSLYNRQVAPFDIVGGNSLARPSCALSVLATTNSPDVSRSIRWTIPGRSTPPMPDSRPLQ